MRIPVINLISPHLARLHRGEISSADDDKRSSSKRENKSKDKDRASVPVLTYPNADWLDPEILPETNCYAYMRNDRNARGPETQPGGKYYTELTCEIIRSAAQRDGLTNPLKEDDCNSVCPPNHHLGYLLIAPKDQGNDYHWIRENINTYLGGRWSQKHGFSNAPTNVDGLNEVITCPSEANHHYAFPGLNSADVRWLNYTEPCGYLCAPNVPATGSRSGLSGGQIAGIATGATVTGLLLLAAASHKWIPNNPISKAIRGLYCKVRKVGSENHIVANRMALSVMA